MKLRIIISTFILFLLIGTGHSALAAPTEKTIHLKINELYIAYIAPDGPYINEDQRLMIPLRAFSELLEGEIGYQNQTKTATVNLLGHQLVFTSGFSTVLVDEQSVEMDTVPVIRDNSMFLPLRIFIDILELNYSWDQEKKLLTIFDDRIDVMKEHAIYELELMDEFDKNALMPLSYSFTEEQDKAGYYRLTIKALNISGQMIPEDKTRFYDIINFTDGQTSMPWYRGMAETPPKSTAEIQANETIEFSRVISVESRTIRNIVILGKALVE